MLFYAVFMLTHFLIIIFIDMQPFYPKEVVPPWLGQLPKDYIALSQDPLVIGVHSPVKNLHYVWFESMAVWIEGFMQTPLAFFGALALVKSKSYAWIIVLTYGLITFPTLIPCFAHILAIPTTDINHITKEGITTLTSWQKQFILANYAPFGIVPFIMSVDAAYRIYHQIKMLSNIQEAAEKSNMLGALLDAGLEGRLNVDTKERG
ncbi:transmembrane protein 6/97 [Cantharellus anzutake]|uniref:transmembrane protein 6/97 n=1 Tax=Cantharellus anzutake TaxID=1750568 RepID=UPI001906A0DD|nr:transmembrane protein 6/97 [Cantharellus anzutake]KAF8329486.1 transmembrane protein 6/97 [Cantharellus anzutake]